MDRNKISFVFLPVFLIMVGCKESSTVKSDNITEENTGKGELIESRIGESELYISIPGDYVLKENAGPDFSVYYFYPLDTTIKAPFSGGIYFGNYPQQFEPDNDSCKIQDIKGRILDNLTNWTIYNCQGKYFVQTLTGTADSRGGGGKIHAFGNAKTQDGVNRVLEIFATMKSKK